MLAASAVGRPFYRYFSVSYMALFLDIYPLSQHATNDALEYIFKSTHDHSKGIWVPHSSPLVRRLIELFSTRGLDRFDEVQTQLLKWHSGENYKDIAPPAVVPGMMGRWNEAELDLVKLYLESLFPGSWTIDDHMMAVDYVVQRYLPHSELMAEADWLSTRATMMGKVQANITASAAEAMTGAVADVILAALPVNQSTATSQFNFTDIQLNALSFSRVRAAENVRSITESVRHKMRSTVVQHLVEKQSHIEGTPLPSLQTKLFDAFAPLNRDWRRIAVTEAGEAQNQGFIASLKYGTKVKRVEVYDNACAFCRKIHDVIAEVVAPNHPNKNPDTMIWVGKNNIGRSASPRKRVGDVLVPREPEEMWWLPAGLAHPHCRGRWVATIEDAEGDDAEFGDWLRDLLG